MKNCQDIQPELSAYVDGELTPPQRAEIETHVASCPRCQRDLAELKALAAGMTALPKLQPAPRFLAEVRRKIAQGREPAESIPWRDHLFRPFWLKVPLEAAALIVIAMFVVRFVKPQTAGKVASFEMAKAEKPNGEPRDAPGYPAFVAQQTAAKAEPAAEPAAESRRRIPAVANSAGGLTIAPAATSGVASWAQSLGINPAKLHDIVTVDARNPGDVRNRAEQLAAKCNGKVIPAPQSKEATGQVFFVELPRECVAGFTSELLRNSGTNALADKSESRGEPAVTMVEPMGSRAGELTGSVETNVDNRFLNRLLLNVEVKPPSSTTTVLEIRVVPPAN